MPQFLAAAGRRGPVVGVQTARRLSGVPVGFEVRTIDGAHTTTIDSLYRSFAQAWDFPDYFGHNMAAFDDCMRDLDHSNMPGPAPSGYLTHITDAQRILSADDAVFDWFAGSMPFYRDHYRDDYRSRIAGHPTVFAVVLSVPQARVETVRLRWRAAGVSLATIEE